MKHQLLTVSHRNKTTGQEVALTDFSKACYFKDASELQELANHVVSELPEHIYIVIKSLSHETIGEVTTFTHSNTEPKQKFQKVTN